MALGHEKLDVYRPAIGYVAWVFEHSEKLASQDVLVVGKSLEEIESRDRKVELDRIAAMLSCLGKRGYSVQGESVGYGVDSDFDPDLLRHLRFAPSIAIGRCRCTRYDPDEMESQPDAALKAQVV